MDGFVTKPLKLSQLTTCLGEVFRVEAPEGAGSSIQASPVGPALGEPGSIPLPTHVLLVEDNLVNQRVAKAMLEKAGMTVEVAENGAVALEYLERASFDLVLMDLQMPVMDGLEATRRIREEEREGDGHLPVVAMTANAMEGDRDRCLAAGMDDYISKPVHARELYGLIARWRRPGPGGYGRSA